MFEERSIPIYTYNIETLLAEKLETVMARGTANTRMRDFYDIHVILEQEKDSIVIENLQKAFLATSQKRDTVHLIPRFYEILDEINQSELMERDWNNFKNNSFFCRRSNMAGCSYQHFEAC
jgi:predicted nucleotidyltransferase component of viral defense system